MICFGFIIGSVIVEKLGCSCCNVIDVLINGGVIFIKVIKVLLDIIELGSFFYKFFIRFGFYLEDLLLEILVLLGINFLEAIVEVVEII